MGRQEVDWAAKAPDLAGSAGGGSQSRVPTRTGLVAIVPRFTSDRAREHARERYGLEARVRELPSYLDQNFLLSVGGEPTYVLKIANSDDAGSLLEGQVAALDHLQREVPGDPTDRLDTPMVARDTDGRAVVPMRSPETRLSHATLIVRYLPGRPMAELRDYPTALLTGLGRGLGDLDLRLAGFDHLSMRRDHVWDLAQAARNVELAEFVESPADRRRVVTRLRRFETTTLPVLSGLPHQVVHNDANDHNVLVTDDGLEPRATGLLDFGDMVWTTRVSEPAIAMTYVMLESRDPIANACALLAGYHSVCPLLESEIRVLLDLIEARLCVSVMMSAYGKSRDPDNEYRLVSEAPAWSLLGRLESRSSADVTDAFLQACESAGAPTDQ